MQKLMVFIPDYLSELYGRKQIKDSQKLVESEEEEQAERLSNM